MNKEEEIKQAVEDEKQLSIELSPREERLMNAYYKRYIKLMSAIGEMQEFLKDRYEGIDVESKLMQTLIFHTKQRVLQLLRETTKEIIESTIYEEASK